MLLQGDLREKGLGLGTVERHWLTRQARAVIHSAAYVSYQPTPDGEPGRPTSSARAVCSNCVNRSALLRCTIFPPPSSAATVAASSTRTSWIAAAAPRMPMTPASLPLRSWSASSLASGRPSIVLQLSSAIAVPATPAHIIISIGSWSWRFVCRTGRCAVSACRCDYR